MSTATTRAISRSQSLAILRRLLFVSYTKRGHCDFYFSCAIQIHFLTSLLTYLLTYLHQRSFTRRADRRVPQHSAGTQTSTSRLVRSFSRNTPQRHARLRWRRPCCGVLRRVAEYCGVLRNVSASPHRIQSLRAVSRLRCLRRVLTLFRSRYNPPQCAEL